MKTVYSKNTTYSVNNLIYQNFHKHSIYTNPIIVDSCAYPEDYAKRAVELGHGIISSVEHGYQGRYIESFEMAEKYNLKYLFGVEAYFVYNRFEKDNTNAHICLLAKNENGRKAINRILSEAAETGFYYRSRVDYELIMSLPEDDVWITSACFLKDTPVLTNHGYKNIQDVTTKDKVLSHLGTWENVISPTKRYYNDDIYNLNIEGCFEDVSCTKDHKFPIVQNNEIVWKRAEDLTTKDKIACVIDTNEVENVKINVNEVLQDYRKEANLGRALKAPILTNFIEVDDEFLQILGLFVAEGSYSHNNLGLCFSLHKNEKDLHEKINHFSLRYLNKNAKVQKKKNSNGVDVMINSKEMALFFRNFVNSGAANKNVPDFIKQLNPVLQMSFVKGYFLGDGSINTGVPNNNRRSPKIVAATISKHLAYDICDILERNHIKVAKWKTKEKIDKKQVHHNATYYFSISSKNFINFWIDFEKNNDLYSFNWNENVNNARKTVSINGNNYILKRVRKINRKMYEGFVYCLNVDNVHSFKIEGVSVHNCLAGLWRYDGKNNKSESLNEEYKNHLEFSEPYEWLIYEFSNKFKDNFYLEVQSHNVDRQKDLNKKIVELSNKYNIEIIAGVDSHFILPQDEWKRDYLQRSTSGIVYDDEDGFYMDYPSGQTLFNRFKTQGVLSDEDIMIALDNTNKFLEVEKYTSVIFNKDMKMPSAPKYKKMTKAEKQRELVGICHHRWEEIKKEIPVEQHQHYLNEIVKELDIIFKIDHEDYFLLNYELIKEATTNRGGMITFSGRGCFHPDTFVIIKDEDGYQFIHDIKEGDYVLTQDGTYHKVEEVYKYDVKEELISLDFKENDFFLWLTKDHKVLRNDNVWVEAKDLEIGDVCKAYDLAEDMTVLSRTRKLLNKDTFYYEGPVYDLRVEGVHSYVAENVVVHNSGPSFYVNHLLGFTQIDRISSPITLYPERFLSTSRMSAGSLADIDFNCGNTKIFEDTQRDILGEGHAYPMIAYGTMKPKSAWKMYCRAVDVDFEISNAISSKIDEYETDLKYWDEESGEEEPNVYDYIPNDLREAFDGSKEFLGLTVSASRHPCGNILLSQNIKEEVGIVRLKSKGGRETICACLDGKWCESYLMLKNDLLTVACVKLAYLLYERVGIPYMSLNGLLAAVKEHPEVWNMYEKGYVIGLNQVEKPSTQRKVMKYKPKNISELSAFIAGIRPAFKSLLDKLINREHFEYGIPTLDKLLQTEELPESFILYQEQIMKILSFAGIPMGDCYTVIKSISKKRFEKIMHYKEQFMTGMEHKLIEEEGISKERAEETAKTIWGIIEDASAYGFNSSHSLSVSFDSLLAAYFKALYPYEFYEVYLNLQMERADKAKALLAKKEMKEAFGISVLPMRFRQDNRKFVALPEQKALSNCLKSIKGFGDRIGEEFYKIKDTHYDDFIDFLVDIDIMKKNKEDSENYNPDIPSGFAVNGSQIEILIMLNYFEEFGQNYKLLKVFKLYNDFSSRKQINKKDINMETGVLKSGKDTYYLDITVFKKYIGKETKSMYKDLNMIGYVKEMASKVPDKSVGLLEQLKFERELLEFPIYQNPSLPKGWYYVIGFKTYGDKINTPYLVLYDLVTSDLVVCSINKSKLFRDNPFGFYSIIHVKSFQDVVKKKKVGEKKFVPTNETKKVIVDYEVILRNEKEELEVLEKQMEEQKNKKEG